eukprot:COSAG02_NODE_3994_length_5940_cov_6.413457_2_plen_42_part_00
MKRHSVQTVTHYLDTGHNATILTPRAILYAKNITIHDLREL